MTKREFALEEGSERRVQLEWRGMWKDFTVSLDGRELGRMNGRLELENGDIYPLEDGTVLEVKLTTGLTTELMVTRDGVPLPGTDADPREQVNAASGVVLFIAGLNLVLGFVAELGQVGLLLEIGAGWTSVVLGVVFLGLGLWARKGSKLALILAIVLFTLDGALGLYFTMEAGGTPGTGGVVMRVFLLIAMGKGVLAMDEAKAKGA